MDQATKQRIENVRQLRKDADQARVRAGAATGKVCIALQEEGYSTLQIAELLGISSLAVFEILKGG